MPADNNVEIPIKELFFQIRGWIRFILSRWLTIVIVGLIGGCLGLLYATLKRPSYCGKLTFVLSDDSKSGGLLGLAGQFGIDVAGGAGSNGAFEGENIIHLLKSRRIVKGALFKSIPGNELLLLNLVGEKEGFFKRWGKIDGLKKTFPFPKDINKLTPVQDSLIAEVHDLLIKKYLDIAKVEKKLSFYSVSVTSSDEIVSVFLTRNLVSEASKMYIETKTKTANENLKMLQKEADSLRSLLNGTIYMAASAVDQTFNLNPALQTQRTPVQKNQIQLQVISAAYGEVIKNLEIAKITLQKETPLYQIIDEPQVPLVKKQLSKVLAVIIGGFLAGFVCVCYILGSGILQKNLRN
jgi:hypothetical protein